MKLESLNAGKFKPMDRTSLSKVLGGDDGSFSTPTTGGTSYANGQWINCTADCIVQDKYGSTIHAEYWLGDGRTVTWDRPKSVK